MIRVCAVVKIQVVHDLLVVSNVLVEKMDKELTAILFDGVCQLKREVKTILCYPWHCLESLEPQHLDVLVMKKLGSTSQLDSAHDYMLITKAHFRIVLKFRLKSRHFLY